MSDPLATYLQDHLAGATFGVNLLKSLRDQHAADAFSDVVAEILTEVEEDEATLQKLADEVGGGSDTLKDATAWLAERASRLKLRFGVDNSVEPDLGTFEALELMSLGILGKLALWRALERLAPVDSRLQSLDFSSLAARAVAQFNRIERYRLDIAPAALRPS